MTIFGTPIETVYLIILIISGSLTILYILFGDFLDGVLDTGGFINPTIILAFFTFMSAIGYVLEYASPLSNIVVLIISIICAAVLVTLLNVFVLIPLSNAEESLGYTEESLKGRIGRVILSIPADGYGEVFIESKSGMISKSARSFDDESIAEGTKVLIIEVKQGVVFVTPHEEIEELYR
ncbi:NfeD family protein [Falsibacillus albus]|uniref:Membrane protein NfeD2 N-terminal transmembrane domain-containing protein n=1 Tax=Falsibacillus albus TaxID=2478915 RepID=A0A3L7JQK3_9BACI|nr:NfeD family protein [Falsibacillus albus]RLQ93097.1 hypothetical protein D9X91_18875 [Falsibacillus albus]